MATEYARLAETLRQGNLVAVVGAGLSLPYQDLDSKKTYPGLPGAAQIVDLMVGRRAYISKGMPFDQACFLYKKREGRAELEQLLLQELDRPGIIPLPAHQLLATMPFASFITTNFDVLLERALRDSRKDPFPLIRDIDIARIRPNHTPIIKIHGCVTQPSTMLACADEFRPMSARVPILDATLKTTLANKVALFLGYGLGDHDFARVITTVKDELGQYMPKSYAVVNAATSFQREYWSEFGVQVIVEDLTTFLKKLSAVSASSPSPAVLSGRDDWRKNDYFRALERIHTMPSETQVIDAFLAHLLDELRAPGRDLATVLARAEQAVVAVLTARDAFEALKQVSTDLFGRIRSTATTKEAAELAVDREIQDRSRIGQGFRRKGQAEIARGDSLLLYSQSKRVAEFLAGVPGGTQDTCQVFVAECRPRSQAPFRDAIAFLELIRSMNGGYRDVKLIPDAIVGNLISRKQVTKVILGAHAAYRRNGKLEAFVNTAGSVLIVDSAIKHGIPIFVVAEEAKVKDLGPADPLPVITYNQEGSIFDSVNNQLAELNIDGKVVGVNIGYDLCAGGPNVTLVTEL